MRTLQGVAAIPSDWPPSAVTIGKFDGVHTGHRAVIERLKAQAEKDGLASVVVTFDRNPLAILAPERSPSPLVSLEQKLELLESTGVDATVVLEFNQQLASLPPDEFVSSILVDALHAKWVLVGRDFRFGHRGAGDVEFLKAVGESAGFMVALVDDVGPDHEHRVSSTWIRDLLASGDIKTASQLLGYPPTVRGKVVHGAARGRELGFPTANLSSDSQGLIPQDGVYAGWLTDGGIRYPTAISVGNNPTFEGVAQKQVEAYVLDEDIDLYDHIVDVSFVERIRGMVAFTGIDPLIAQIGDDVERVRKLLL